VSLFNQTQSIIRSFKQNQQFRLSGYTLLYLLFPNLIFVGGWFRWEIGILALFILVIAFYKSLLLFDGKVLANDQTTNNKLKAWLLLISVFICIVSGIGGFTFQGDVDKHYGILRDLIVLPWPVVYEENFLVDSAVHLNYYLGYYLPVAFISKVTGLALADAFMFVWTVTGLYLTLRWVVVLAGRSIPLVAVAIFLFFGGQDFLYALIKIPIKWMFTGELIPFQIFKMEIATEAVVHNNILQFYSPMVSMTWCPQHVLGGWLATALIFYQYEKQQSVKSIVFIFTLTFIWSVFNAFGFVLILLFLLIKKGIPAFLTFQNIVGGLVLVTLMGFYFQAHYSIAESGWLWQVIPGNSWLPKMLAFLLIEFGFYALLSFYFVKQQSWKLIWWSSCFTLILLPLYVIGYFNDFLMRAAVPSLFIISIAFIQYFGDLKYRYKYQLLVLFIVLANIPYLTLRYRVKDEGAEQQNVANSLSVTKLREEKWFNAQYFGKNNSIYWLYLASKQRRNVDELLEDIQSKETTRE